VPTRPSWSAVGTADLRDGRGSSLTRVAIGLVIAIAAIVYFTGHGGSPNSDIDSCWKSAGGDEYTPVDCTSPDAEYRVVAEVDDASKCPNESEWYLDSKEAGAADRYRCLVPVTH
jgi:hypothetical protein